MSQVRPEELSHSDGVILVKTARACVEAKFRGEKPKPPINVSEKLKKLGAAFVTIETFYGYDKRELRGCIGYIQPVKPLIEAVCDVAIEAAFSDPRFPPLAPEELDRVTFEVSVLGPLEPLPKDPRERVKAFKIGVHGLVVRRGFFQGLLLPQVPIEYGWDEETFLAETCVKAGLPPYCWLEEDTEFYRFSARVWREREPKGDIEERNLVEEARSKRLT